MQCKKAVWRVALHVHFVRPTYLISALISVRFRLFFHYSCFKASVRLEKRDVCMCVRACVFFPLPLSVFAGAHVCLSVCVSVCMLSVYLTNFIIFIPSACCSCELLIAWQSCLDFQRRITLKHWDISNKSGRKFKSNQLVLLVANLEEG